MARPKIEIDPEQVQKLAAIGTKVTEIADILGCSRETLHGRFSTELAKGKAALRSSLRIAQISAAKQGNSTMLVWLGKQYLGQSDTSIDEYITDAIQQAGLSKEDLLELIKNKDELFKNQQKRTFEEFCEKAGYPAPFAKQIEMKDFALNSNDPCLLLGSRKYGKTDYVTIMGTAYDIYLDPMGSTNLIITKSKDRNSAIIFEIAEACRKNGMSFEIENTTRLRALGIEGKQDSVSMLTIKTKGLRGHHPRRVIMDDPVTEDDTSEATRVHARHILNEVMKLTTRVTLIGQPAHQYDLYADVRGKIRTMEVPMGSIPELDAGIDIEAMRLAGVSEASISASYLLKVLSEGTTPFDKVRYIDKMIPGDAVAWIDPSEGGDYTAVTILKGYLDGVAVEGYVWKKAWNHCLDDMAPFFKKHQVRKLAFETNCTGEMPIELLRKLFPSMGVIGRRATTNKHARIMAAGAFAHKIHLSKESHRLYLDHTVKYEYKSKFDDAPDSLASCMEWVGLVRGKK